MSDVFMMSEVYVQALYDFQYFTEDGNEIKLKAGEELLLVQKSNENWWKVIRNSDKQTFFAPSSYLSIVGLSCKKLKDLSDVNSNFNCGILQENQDRLHLKSEKSEIVSQYLSEFVKTANAIKSARIGACFETVHQDECLHSNLCDESIEESFLNESTQNEITSSKNYSPQDSLTSIFANIPSCLRKSPPTPKSDQKPLRKLSNNCYEYLDKESQRKYYFHCASGKTTWKPPRREENTQSSPSPKESLSNSSLDAPNPPPKQLKPKLNKLAHSSNESLDSQSSPCMFTILPHGWTEEHDYSTGTIYYYNVVSKKKWYASSDENGRTYFYDEDNNESVWELPDISSMEFEELCQENSDKICLSDGKSYDGSDLPIIQSGLSSFKLNKTSPDLQVARKLKTRSLVVPECVNLANLQDKDFLPVSFGEGYWPSVQDGHYSIARKGTLNKTKLIEGGKRIRKNWTSSFVVLTDVFLLFYKDIRSAHLAATAIKPELCIDLNGALVQWCPEKSSRKNVFEISTVLGHQLLLQDDNAQTTKEWFNTIQAAIMMLPSSFEQVKANSEENERRDIKLSRSKSTKQCTRNDENVAVLPPEKKRKIRDKLKQFFNRRPTLESLREKGILQDEPVFGCLLENLCLRENQKVPRFVLECIEVIEERGIKADGLYRASGNLSQVQKIRINVNLEDYSCLENEEDVHVLTGALKLFFREMKEPLFPFNLFEKFLSAIALPESNSKLEALKKLVRKMPLSNYETLKMLLQHLLRVTKYHKHNRMQVQNLAIVFGPTLMWPEYASTNIALDMMHQNRIVEFLLLEYEAIF